MREINDSTLDNNPESLKWIHHDPRDPESWCIKGANTSTLKENSWSLLMYHNPRDPESWCIKGTDESTLDNNLSGPLIQHDLNDLVFLCIKRTSESTLEFNDLLRPVNTTRSTILNQVHQRIQ